MASIPDSPILIRVAHPTTGSSAQRGKRLSDAPVEVNLGSRPNVEALPARPKTRSIAPQTFEKSVPT
jgi:hypothetical protein